MPGERFINMDYFYENNMETAGFSPCCGIDEAGRGPLAGPVCAAAVILPKGLVIDGLNDSKKLSPKKREKLFDIIKNEAVAYGVGWASETEIDKYNILQATFAAMRRAAEKLGNAPESAIVDGNRDPQLGLPTLCIVGGDGKSPSIAAASILAKTARDAWMRQLDLQYPGYGFAQHKGYGTRQHQEALDRLGVCSLHRRTFRPIVARLDQGQGRETRSSHG